MANQTNVNNLLIQIKDPFAYFKEDSIDREYVAIFQEALRRQRYELQSFYDNAYSWYPLVEILYNQNLISIWNKIPLDILQKFFGALIDSMPNVCTYECILSIIKILVGPDTTIEFVVTDDRHLTINLGGVDNDTNHWVDDRIDADYMVTENNDYLTFQLNYGALSATELRQVIAALMPPYIIYDNITINEVT